MQAARILLVSIGLVLALAGDGFAGPASTTSTTTTTTTTSTTTLRLPVCMPDIEVDPADTVASLTAGVTTLIPITITGPGVFDYSASDGGAGGTLGAGCRVHGGGAGAFQCSYTPPASPPAEVVISAGAWPHSVDYVCDPSSLGDFDSKTFPVTTPTTSSTTTTTTTSSTTTTLPDGRVAVCHKGRKTHLVKASKLERHLRHGDSEGPCAAD